MIPANDNDHQVHERAWVIVLDGEVEIKTSAGNSVTGRSGLLGPCRENGQGRAAYEPSMMVSLLLYAHARRNRSSRGIERGCREDVVSTMYQVPPRLSTSPRPCRRASAGRTRE